MTEPQHGPQETWRAVIEEILAQSENPGSGIAPLTPSQRLYLRLVSPIMIDNGYAFLAVPDERGKYVIESELAEHITTALGHLFGRPFSVAVSLAQPDSEASTPHDEPTTEVTIEPHAKQEPTQTEWKDSFAPPVDPDVTAPASLDELANNHRLFAHHTHSSSQARLPRETPAHDPNRETSLNPKYTFDSFVIGSSNRFANGAAVAVAESPALAYNPLFIWGGSGLGKTHLLHAAGNYAQVLHPGLRVKYVSSEELTNDFINSLRDGRQESFKRRYRNLDILMVDDIQFLAGKESTQEEFFHTFNALHQANKQIILSSDRPPKQLTTLEDRLRTRFEGGLITDIQPPDLETRIAILMKKAESDGTQIDREVLELIASRFENSIRELEGALIRVSAYSSLVSQPINMEMAEIALRDLVSDSASRQITATVIIDVTADYFNIDAADLRGAGKKRTIAHARQLAMYLCRELTEMSLPKIGEEFGGKDHTTVMYADRKIRKEMNENRETYTEIQELTSKIHSAARS